MADKTPMLTYKEMRKAIIEIVASSLSDNDVRPRAKEILDLTGPYYVEKGRQIADTKWRQILKDRDAGTDMSFGTLAELQDTVMRASKAGVKAGRQMERERIFNVLNNRKLYILKQTGKNPSGEDWKALKGEAQ